MIEERIEIRDDKKYKAYYEDGVQAKPAELIIEVVPAQASKVKPLKAIINSLITEKGDGTFDFAQAKEFSEWLNNSWARQILQPVLSMPEAEISIVEARMLIDFISSEVTLKNLSNEVGNKIVNLLGAVK